MILVELVRLVVVLALTAAGYELGKSRPDAMGLPLLGDQASILVFSVVGAGVGYVFGGVAGRTLLRAIGAVERKVDRVGGPEFVSGSVGVLAGVLASLLVSWPILALVGTRLISYPLVALAFVILSYSGFRISVRKRFDVLGSLGLSQPRRFRPLIEGRSTSAGKILDTSAIIDGRILEVARSGFFAGHVICPRFVLAELQSIADAADPLRRARGRRGLEVLESLESDPRVFLEVTDDEMLEHVDVDAKLIGLAQRLGGALVTTDFNLHRVAELQGVAVLNVNSLAASLRPVFLPGEHVTVRIIREGSQRGQGVGYLDDGTMVVVEAAGDLVGKEVDATVTSVLQTGAGRMLFSTRNEHSPE